MDYRTDPHASAIDAAVKEIEENYVSRWGVVRMRLPFGEVGAVLEAIKDVAVREAEHRGGTIDRDAMEIKGEGIATYAEWKMRLNDRPL